MRLFFLFTVLSVLVATVSAWEKEDHEIFDLVSEIEASEGKGTSFYSWLDVPSTASTAQISKAYRRKSMLLHPDKNPGVKGIHERFARLGVIAAILRDPAGRTRYDHFYKNGVPRWRGTGYYYSRWRPGMVEVLIFLTILTSGLQYTVQLMTHKNDLKRIEIILSDARLAAWGPKRIPIDGKRKVKVPIGGTPRVDHEGNQIGRMVDMVVEGNGSISILDDTGDLHRLDTDSATPAAISRTWPIVLASFLISKIITQSPKDSDEHLENHGADESESGSESPGSMTPSNEEASAVLKGGRTAAVKVGGKRRKAIRRR